MGSHDDMNENVALGALLLLLFAMTFLVALGLQMVHGLA